MSPIIKWSHQELHAMDTGHHTAEYEAALAEERLLWAQLEAPLTDVSERVKAFARWSAAAERARAISSRMHEQATAAEPQ
jgi:hypothetical protein